MPKESPWSGAERKTTSHAQLAPSRFFKSSHLGCMVTTPIGLNLRFPPVNRTCTLRISSYTYPPTPTRQHHSMPYALPTLRLTFFIWSRTTGFDDGKHAPVHLPNTSLKSGAWYRAAVARPKDEETKGMHRVTRGLEEECDNEWRVRDTYNNAGVVPFLRTQSNLRIE